MDAFFSLNETAPFLVREGSCENCFGLKEGAMEYIGIKKGFLKEFQDRIRYVSGIHEISGGIWLIPHRTADYSAISQRNDLYIRKTKPTILTAFPMSKALSLTRLPVWSYSAAVLIPA